MVKVRRRITLFVPITVGVLMAVGTAHADVAKQGDDTSNGTNSNERVFVCDREADGHGVHTDAYDWYGNYFRADDQNGSQEGCDDTARMGGAGVYSHRTVEEVTGFDYLGDYDYHP